MLIHTNATTDHIAHVDSVSGTSAQVNTYASLVDYFNAQPPISTLEITGTGITYESATAAATVALGEGWELKGYEGGEIIAPPKDLPEPPGPVPQWIQFSGSLIQMPEIKALLRVLGDEKGVNQPGFGYMLSVGLGQASQGGSCATFAAAWGFCLATGIVSPEFASTVKSLGESFYLPADFLEVIQPTT